MKISKSKLRQLIKEELTSVLSESVLNPADFGFTDEDPTDWAADPVGVTDESYSALVRAVRSFLKNRQPGERISQNELSSFLFGTYMTGLNVLIDEVPESNLVYDQDGYDEVIQDDFFIVTN